MVRLGILTTLGLIGFHCWQIKLNVILFLDLPSFVTISLLVLGSVLTTKKNGLSIMYRAFSKKSKDMNDAPTNDSHKLEQAIILFSLAGDAALAAGFLIMFMGILNVWPYLPRYDIGFSLQNSESILVAPIYGLFLKYFVFNQAAARIQIAIRETEKEI